MRRPRQAAAAASERVEEEPRAVVLRTRFDLSGTFTERDVMSLPAYGDLVRQVERMIDHHRRASARNDFAS